LRTFKAGVFPAKRKVSELKILRTILEMRRQADAWRAQGLKIGFIPTMGSLHEGHLSLVRIAKSRADVTVASIFVNPTQFGPTEDFSDYPRDEKGDLAKLEGEKTDCVFFPTAEAMYPEGFQTSIHLSRITQGLCGKNRPGHFDGVATVVLKLFHLVKPHVAVFGEKDYQQLAVIRRMVEDLSLDLEIVGGPTVRDPEGLALSSRNSYLRAEERQQALGLSQAIGLVQRLHRNGETRTDALTASAKKLFESFPGVNLEYLEIVDARTLEPLPIVDQPARMLIAARVGKTRLIDNGPVQI
jgi:pantoate--beta-alanine ligase